MPLMLYVVILLHSMLFIFVHTTFANHNTLYIFLIIISMFECSVQPLTGIILCVDYFHGNYKALLKLAGWQHPMVMKLAGWHHPMVMKLAGWLHPMVMMLLLYVASRYDAISLWEIGVFINIIIIYFIRTQVKPGTFL